MDGAGATWLVWERIDGAVSLDEVRGAPSSTCIGICGSRLLAALSGMVQSATHDLGYIHRDVKPENFRPRPMRSFTHHRGCCHWRRWQGSARGRMPAADRHGCGGVGGQLIEHCSFALGATRDARLDRLLSPPASPCTPPPSSTPTHGAPFAFDVFSLGVSYLRLGLSALRTDAALEAFRAELAACDGRLGRLGPLQAALDRVGLQSPRRSSGSSSQAMPSHSSRRCCGPIRRGGRRCRRCSRTRFCATLATVTRPAAAMATAIPRRRRRVAHRSPGGRRLLRRPPYDAVERPLTLTVALDPPLGLLVGEVGEAERQAAGATLAVDGIVEGGAAASSGKVGRGGPHRLARRRLRRATPARTLRSRCAAAWRRWPSAWSGAGR